MLHHKCVNNYLYYPWIMLHFVETAITVSQYHNWDIVTSSYVEWSWEFCFCSQHNKLRHHYWDNYHNQRNTTNWTELDEVCCFVSLKSSLDTSHAAAAIHYVTCCSCHPLRHMLQLPSITSHAAAAIHYVTCCSCHPLRHMLQLPSITSHAAAAIHLVWDNIFSSIYIYIYTWLIIIITNTIMMPNRRNCVAIGCCFPTVPIRIIIIIEILRTGIFFLCDLLTRARSGCERDNH